jgi:hypothetical protein
MALFPTVTIKSKDSTETFIPLHVDQRKFSAPKSGLTDLGITPRLGVEYMKTYVYIDISNIQEIPKSMSKALFDMFFDAQDHENILDIEVVYFQGHPRQQKEICRYKFKGWITQYAIIAPVTDLQQYVAPDWDPSFGNLQSSFPSIGGGSYMALLRLELTGATDDQNRKYNKLR